VLLLLQPASTASSGKGSSMTEKPLLLVDATC